MDESDAIDRSGVCLGLLNVLHTLIISYGKGKIYDSFFMLKTAIKHI